MSNPDDEERDIGLERKYAARKLLEAAKLARLVLREALEAGPPWPVGRKIPGVLDALAEGIALVEYTNKEPTP